MLTSLRIGGPLAALYTLFQHRAGGWRGALALLLTLAVVAPVAAQVPAWQQLIYDQNAPRSFSVSRAQATAMDAAGNIVVAGIFQGQLTFGSTRLTSDANNDIFIAKYNPVTRTWLWATRDTGSLVSINALALEGTSIYLAGTIISSATNVVAGTALPAIGGNDILVAKYTDTGSGAQGRWAFSGGSGGDDAATGIAASGADVFVTGIFTGTSTLGGVSLTSAGYSDIFTARYTDNGGSATAAWAQRIGGSGTELAGNLVLGNGGVYITGSFTNTVSVAGQNMTSTLGSNGFTSRDLLLAKYSPAGVAQWGLRNGGPGSDYGTALAVSGADIYLAGEFSSTATFAGTSLTSTGNQDVLLAKYRDTGTTAAGQWAVHGGGGSLDEPAALAVDGADVYVTGTFTANTFVPVSIAGVALTSKGGTDVFVAKYTDAGSTATGQWANTAGGGTDDFAYSVVAGSAGVFLGMATGGETVVFGPNPGQIGTSSTATLVPVDAATGTWGVIGVPNNGGRSVINEMVTDATGDVFVAGVFTSDVVFGSTQLSAQDPTYGYDIFLAKYSPATNTWLWAVRGGSDEDDDVTGLALVGNKLYVSGTFASAANAVIAGTALPGAGRTDGFLAAYTDQGTTVTGNWAVSAGGTGDDTGESVAASGTSVYLAGTYAATPTVAGITLPTVAGSSDVYLAKYTDAGPTATNGWAVRGGGRSTDDVSSVAVSGSNVYITGFYPNTGPPTYAGVTLPAGSSTETYLAKYVDTGSSATDGWAFRVGSAGGDIGRAVAAVGPNVYLVVSANSLSPGTYAGMTLPVIGQTDVVLAKYIDNGATVTNGWALRTGTTGLDYPYGLAVSGNRLYVTGSFTVGTNTFTPAFGDGTTSSPFTRRGSNDLFLARYTDNGSTGSFVWAADAGGSTYEYAYAVAVSGTAVYMAGGVGVPGGLVSSPPPAGTIAPYFGPFSITNAADDNIYYVARLNDAPAPVITSITPGSGTIGGAVVLTGTNLTGTTSVTFSGVSGPVTVTSFVVNAAGTQITGLVVPVGAATGPVTASGPGGTSNGIAFILPGPQLAVAQGSTPYPSGGPAYDFGSVAVGSTSAPVTFTLSNPGTAPLALTGITTTGNFAVSGTAPTSVPAGGTASVSVTFAPTAAGIRLGTLVVNSALGPYTVALTGRGLPAPTVISYSPGLAPVGTTVTVTGTSFVAGSTTVTLNGIVLTGVVVSGSTGLSFVVPAGALGGMVVVTTPGGSASFQLCVPYVATATGAAGCAGSTATLTATGAPTGGSYVWYATATSQTALAGGSTGSFVTPALAATTTYYVAIVSDPASPNSCTGTRTAVAATVNPAPPVAVAVTGTPTFCAGGSVTLTASGADTYLWSNGQTTASIVVTTPGNYSVAGTLAATGCTATPAPVAVTVNPLPATPTITQSAGGALSSSAPTGNQWYFNTTPIPGATGATYTVPGPAANGSYTVVATSAAGCVSAASAAVAVVLTGTTAATGAAVARVFPNPATGTCTVLLPAGSATTSVVLLDAVGRVVRSGVAAASATSTTLTLNVAGLARGIYTVRVQTATGLQSQRLVLE